MSFNYIFFDLDGTLTDSAPGITRAVQHALIRFGLPKEELEELKKFIGPPLAKSFQKYYGMSEEMARQGIVYYREYYADQGKFENRVYEGIREVLEELKARGKKLVVATSKPDQFTNQILEHFAIDSYFDYVSASTMDESRVDKGEIIAYGIEQLGITDTSQILMVGDREHDILGAKKNKLASLGVLYGFGSREELEAAGADYIAETPEDILKYC